MILLHGKHESLLNELKARFEVSPFGDIRVEIVTSNLVPTEIAYRGFVRVLPRAMGYGDPLRQIRLSASGESSHVAVENSDTRSFFDRRLRACSCRTEVAYGEWHHSNKSLARNQSNVELRCPVSWERASVAASKRDTPVLCISRNSRRI